MGLTYQASGLGAIRENFIKAPQSSDYIIALAGNPNTGKSTIFNALTGLKQHTGNWPGKTVTQARGFYRHQEKTITLVDLPGTYSLLASSSEEQVARDFLCFAQPEATVVVVDATCLERNLNLVLQITEITHKVVVCLNLMDEAKRKHLAIDVEQLATKLGVPVVPTVARSGEGLRQLKDTINAVAQGKLVPKPLALTYPHALETASQVLATKLQAILPQRLNARWVALRLLEDDPTLNTRISQYLAGDNSAFQKIACSVKQLQLPSRGEIRDAIVATLYQKAEAIAGQVVKATSNPQNDWDRKLDDLVTSKTLGYPLMLLLLGGIFWLTISGANYPSALLAQFLFAVEGKLAALLSWLKAPEWLSGLLVLGAYRSLAWVVSVMLPPMAIFFPLFTLLEDLGYLPRIAFNLDRFFQRAGAHGKQALTMAMGFGCNAAGVIAARIIDSPRERLLAILTNTFVPCNGRFPLLITMAMLLTGAGITSGANNLLAVGIVVSLILAGIGITFFVSWVLSRTILKGMPSSFSLELPPYRKPQVLRIIVRSIFDRTLFVLGRAALVAAPAGALTWLLANCEFGGLSLLAHIARWLAPLGQIIGLDGFILLAFILGLPANEIVVPILLMSYLAEGAMVEFNSLTSLRALLYAQGWNWVTALNMMLFSLLHFPCATTLLTIRKETGSLQWTCLAALIPTIVAFFLCFLVAQGARLCGWG